jgi:hypothetical protein
VIRDATPQMPSKVHMSLTFRDCAHSRNNGHTDFRSSEACFRRTVGIGDIVRPQSVLYIRAVAAHRAITGELSRARRSDVAAIVRQAMSWLSPETKLKPNNSSSARSNDSHTTQTSSASRRRHPSRQAGSTRQPLTRRGNGALIRRIWPRLRDGRVHHRPIPYVVRVGVIASRRGD